MEKTNENGKKRVGSVLIPAACFLIIGAFAAILLIRPSREWFKAASKLHPYIMGFVKFALLATVGEIFGLSIRKKEWTLPTYWPVRLLIWGVIGVAITFMMRFYSGGTARLIENLFQPAEKQQAFGPVLLRAFLTALLMNATFGPVFMAFHKCTDKTLDLRAEGVKKPGLHGVLKAVDWEQFISFTVLKTIPFFWVPAHTLTFLLPDSYQVIAAAALSIALGIILSLKTGREKKHGS